MAKESKKGGAKPPAGSGTVVAAPRSDEWAWKPGSRFPVPASVAAGVVDALREEHGLCRPEDMVEASRLPGAPLHGCFDWNDETAAETARRATARKIIGSIVHLRIVRDDSPEGTEMLRGAAYMNVRQEGRRGYERSEIAAQNEHLARIVNGDLARQVGAIIRRMILMQQLAQFVDDVPVTLRQLERICQQMAQVRTTAEASEAALAAEAEPVEA